MPLIRTPFRVFSFAATMLLCALAAPGRAEVPLLADQLPKELDGVGIVEHRNETIPLDLQFKDEDGREVRLRDYFSPGKPVLLTINYFKCPMLCTLQLNGMVDGLNVLEIAAGKDFQIITVSMSPKEGPELARPKKDAYLTQYKKPSAAEGWHFLTGQKTEIEALCKAVGFGYRLDPKSGDYAHTPTIMFLTPDGRISRYMSNVQFEPRDLKLALIEASEGTIGSAMDHFLLLMCYHYDPLANSYAADAMKIMRLGGAVTAILIAAGLGLLWWKGSGPRTPAVLAAEPADMIETNQRAE